MKNQTFVVDTGFVDNTPSIAIDASAKQAGLGFTAELIKKIKLRLRGAALVVAAVLLVNPVVFSVWWSTGKLTAPVFWMFQGINLLALVLVMGLYAAARHPTLDFSKVLLVGVAFEIYLCMQCSMAVQTMHFLKHGHITTPVLTYVVALVFAVLLPLPLKRTLLVATAAASTMPLSLILLQVFGVVHASNGDVLNHGISMLMVIALVGISSHVVYGMSRELADAQRMGSYKLVEPINRGAMGEIWKASHQMLARPAAVKLIRRDRLVTSGTLSSESMLALFESEAQVTANLQSPHTIRLYDYGVASDGTIYYVMELLNGQDLESLVHECGPLPPARSIHLLLQLCHSIAEAHQHNLLHRDIKPANVIVCREVGGDPDFLKVLDFGLVGLRTNSDDQKAKTTAGTIGYIPPEALLRGEMDVRGDIYAIGAVGYWILAGLPVYTGETAEDILNQTTFGTIKTPSERSGRELPQELENVVMQCLAKEPGKRPQTVKELMQQLRDCPLSSRWNPKDALRWWDTKASFPTS